MSVSICHFDADGSETLSNELKRLRSAPYSLENLVAATTFYIALYWLTHGTDIFLD
jgi:hypothetical protein